MRGEGWRDTGETYEDISDRPDQLLRFLLRPIELPFYVSHNVTVSSMDRSPMISTFAFDILVVWRAECYFLKRS